MSQRIDPSTRPTACGRGLARDSAPSLGLRPQDPRRGIPSGVEGRAEPVGLHTVVRSVLRETQRRHGALFAVQRRWRTLVGKELAAHTKPVSLRNKRLIIHVDRPGDSFTLNYQRSRLLERVKRITQGKIEEIVVRAGEVHAVSD